MNLFLRIHATAFSKEQILLLLQTLNLKIMLFQCDYVGPLSRQMSVPDEGFPVYLDNLGDSKDDKELYKVTA
jgi:hypothetical protein